MTKTALYLSVITIGLLCIPLAVLAQNRLESSQYAIVDSDVDSVSGVSESTNYQLISSLDPLSDSRMTSGSYLLSSGFPSGIQANVPLIGCAETDTDDTAGGYVDTSCTDPALTASTGGNDSIAGNGMIGICSTPGCGDKAKIELDDQDNPVDALYLVAISTDNFASDIKYLKSDRSLTTTLDYANYMTICELQGYDSRDTGCDDDGDVNWSQGKQEYNISGLSPNTTYYVKARAISGDFTETQYSPVVTFETVSGSSITLDLDTASTDIETSPEYQVHLGVLQTSVVNTGDNYLWIDVSTNASNGINVYLESTNNGLLLNGGSYTIPSETEDLGTGDGDGGYGVQGTSATEAGNGPLQIDSNFNISGNNVRGLTTSAQRVLFTDTAGTNQGPVTDGRGQLTLKARGDVAIPAGTFNDTVVVTAVGSW